MPLKVTISRTIKPCVGSALRAGPPTTGKAAAIRRTRSVPLIRLPAPGGAISFAERATEFAYGRLLDPPPRLIPAFDWLLGEPRFRPAVRQKFWLQVDQSGNPSRTPGDRAM
jgi:hypothetical protein